MATSISSHATQQIAVSMENAAKRLSYTKPRSHLMTSPNITLGTSKRNSRPVFTITTAPLNIERKEMQRNSQKHFGMLKILAMSLYSNAILLIGQLLTNPGLEPAIKA